MRKLAVFAAVLFILLYLGGCAKPYVKAEKAYFKGDPVKAEEIITPVAEKEVEKDRNEKNRCLWDLGVYRFTQGNWDGALEAFRMSVTDFEEVHSTGDGVKSFFFSKASQKYVGYPVEISSTPC